MRDGEARIGVVNEKQSVYLGIVRFVRSFFAGRLGHLPAYLTLAVSVLRRLSLWGVFLTGQQLQAMPVESLGR